jgi:hypothetical protein
VRNGEELRPGFWRGPTGGSRGSRRDICSRRKEKHGEGGELLTAHTHWCRMEAEPFVEVG